MRRRALVASSVFVVSGLAACLGACVADTANPLAPPADAGPFEFDGSQHPFDAATGRDASQPQPDAEVDATTPEDSPTLDTSVPDTNVDDAGTDTNVDDTGTDVVVVADTGTDTGVDAGVDAGMDAGHDSGIDAGVDSGPVDAGPPNCAVKIFGDYYTRTDGTVVYMVGAQKVVMSAATNQPLKTVVSVAPQQDHACALLSDQTVWCWASNTNGNISGDLGDGTTSANPTTFSATQVVTQPPDAGAAYLTSVIAIDEGSDSFYTHPTCAIRSDHTVWCWGASGSSGGPPAGIFYGTTNSVNPVPYAIAIASGPTPTDGGATPLVHADKVTVGNDALCYLTSGKVYCLGGDYQGELGDFSDDKHFISNFQSYPVAVVESNGMPATIDSLASGYRFACALGGGSVWCWGSDGAGQMGNQGPPVDICNLNYCQSEPVQVQSSAAVRDAGVNQSPLLNVAAISGGYQYSCALDTGGNLRCWGAIVGGVTAQPEATLYNSGAAPSSNIVQFSLSPEQGDINNGVRYLTGSGVLVSKQTVINQVCP